MTEAQIPREQIDRYLRLNFYKIEGYMDRLDANLFRELIVAQIKSGIVGSLVEIGVHYGRSFFVLASGRSGTEKSLGVDLFEDDDLYKHPHRIRPFRWIQIELPKIGPSFFEYRDSEGKLPRAQSGRNCEPSGTRSLLQY